jgi:hypothetical protein
VREGSEDPRTLDRLLARLESTSVERFGFVPYLQSVELIVKGGGEETEFTGKVLTILILDQSKEDPSVDS